MARAYIGLGSNLGDRGAQLDFALTQLSNATGVSSVRTSAYYETAPVGPIEQDDFLNAVAELETTLTPEELFSVLQNIEQLAGRTREVRWGPRTLDLDLLDYDGLAKQTATLTLPHPEAHRRAFVLAPWAELAPNHRLAGQSVTDWLANLGDTGVRRV